MRRRTAALLTTLALSAVFIAVPGAAIHAQEDSPDLYLEMPYTLGGYDTEVVMSRGEEHFANLEPGDPADDQTRAEIEGMLEQVGAGIDDMVTGYALVSQDDLFSFVVAIRIAGIEPGSLLPAYLPILERGLQDATTSDETIAGKPVVKVSSLGADDEYADVYVYDAGDTLWLVQGPDDVVERALSDLR